MSLVSPPVCDFGWSAPGFTLPATDGRQISLADIRGPNGTLVMFICNHCPYVLRVLDQIIKDASRLRQMDIGVAAISSNDANDYPQDSFENMARMATDRAFPFPYLYDEDQTVGRAYNANAPRISSASTPPWNCSTVVAWTNWSPQCARSQTPVAARATKHRQWAVR